MKNPIEMEKIRAVSNTGPLISAFQSRMTYLLKRYFSVIYITASELVEFEKHGWIDDIQSLINDGLVIVVEKLLPQEKMFAEQIAKRIAEDPSSGDPKWINHLPEAEAMALMKNRFNLMIEFILLDEKAARNVAKELGLNITGFPGIIGRAGMEGLINEDEIRKMLKICQQQGTHYSNKLIETVAQTYGSKSHENNS